MLFAYQVSRYIYKPDIMPIKGSMTDNRIMPTITDKTITRVGSNMEIILVKRWSISSWYLSAISCMISSRLPVLEPMETMRA